MQDHHGDEIKRRLDYLDRAISDVMGESEKVGGVESLINNCMQFLDDLSDGIEDGEHQSLHVWRPEAHRLPLGANRYEEPPEDKVKTTPQRQQALPPRGVEMPKKKVPDKPEVPKPRPTVTPPGGTSSPPPPPPEAEKYFIRRNKKKVHGPITGEQIKSNIDKGKVLPSDQVSTQEDGPWHAAGSLDEFKPHFKN